MELFNFNLSTFTKRQLIASLMILTTYMLAIFYWLSMMIAEQSNPIMLAQYCSLSMTIVSIWASIAAAAIYRLNNINSQSI